MALSEKELLELSKIQKKKIRKALFSYCDKYGIRCKSRKTFIDATMDLFEKGLEDTLSKLQKKRIEEYRPEDFIPIAHAPVSIAENRIYCRICRDYVDAPKNKFVFSTHKETGKRQIKHSQHCDKCGDEIQYCKRLFEDSVFQSISEEQIEKERLTLSGQEWTEE